MKRSEIKNLKKLNGVYKQAIDACNNVTYSETQRHFRRLTMKRIDKVNALLNSDK
jgi:hypothetical protein